MIYDNIQTKPPIEDVIEHHGIKGMKWGVRRYQNEDGTYTKKGIKRYALNRDVNDKSRKNIAKIRTGEAKRRLDTAKKNNPTNYTRIAELKGRLRSAKRNEKFIRKIDKGTKLAAKGQTIGGNNLKSFIGLAASSYASGAITKYLNKRLSSLDAIGKWTPAHTQVASIINKAAGYGLQALAVGYSIKKYSDNNALRAYQRAHYSGRDTIKNVGSQEYADRVESQSKKKKS